MINKKMIFFLKNEIEKKFTKIYGNKTYKSALDIQKKQDKSVVTEIDIFISDLVKNELTKYTELKGLNFYSEEDQDCFDFPCLVLDPIDGTKALVTGVPECCVSLAILSNDRKETFGWLYNPFNGFEISSVDQFIRPPNFSRSLLVGMVSRSDFEKGLFSKSLNNEQTILFPKGSIAYKLGLLAAGACDFIISMTPKNIWDIAAGTVILETRGYKMYQKGVEITDLNLSFIEGDLIWCRPENIEEIRIDLVN